MFTSTDSQQIPHPTFSRRSLVQAGAASVLGLGMSELAAWRALADSDHPAGRAKSVIFIFAIGGMSQHETFDMKPDAPDNIRGEFLPIDTNTPGIRICEHMPMLARQSHRFALLRSLAHPNTSHKQSCMLMFSGRSKLPPRYKDKDVDGHWPSIVSQAGYATKPRSNLPKAMMLPEVLFHNATTQVPGQTAGEMGREHDPWLVEAMRECKGNGYPTRGVCPDCYPLADYKKPHKHTIEPLFATPNLEFPSGVDDLRFNHRQQLLDTLDAQRRDLERFAEVAQFDRQQQRVASLLIDRRTRAAFDIFSATPKVLERYGQNKFGWSLLMARRLVASGVNIVQVHLGHNFTWDTHSQVFPILKDRLLPPADRAISALIEDLAESGELNETLVVMAGEFGRTPKVFLPKGSKNTVPGRGHWGAVQTVFFAGGGVQGGTVVGSSDKHGGHPVDDMHTPEDFAATIYDALGIPHTAAWHDREGRPHHIYHGEPIRKLI